MSPSAPEQLDPAGPRGGPAGGPATGREVSDRLAWMPALPPVALYRSRPDGSPRNVRQARIDGVERHGGNVRVHLDGPIMAVADITPAALAGLDLPPGQTIWAPVRATETRSYPA
ncbi:TOBE domain-containing protein [Nonomuraea sp. NPDC050153]|uniref:TOBE domain-containing protein n=1 Tax=Nonomuraea sp. NPDC050153 TaxID=3364359 RepID=UPI0037966D25